MPSSELTFSKGRQTINNKLNEFNILESDKYYKKRTVGSGVLGWED